MASPDLPPPNWYPDPQTDGVERWWDGAQWTAHQRAKPEPTADGPSPDQSPQLASEGVTSDSTVRWPILVAGTLGLLSAARTLMQANRTNSSIVAADLIEAGLAFAITCAIVLGVAIVIDKVTG